MNIIDTVPAETAARASAIAPIQAYLDALHARVSGVTEGAPAAYIPQLAKADPNLFGIAMATVDGQIYTTGDTNAEFTIQSVSKPFMYGYALQHYGRERVLEKVGVEPTGDAFNSLALDEEANRPFNPMVNAGAIAVAEMMQGHTQQDRIGNMVELFSSLAGRPLKMDEAIFTSELATGHRNRAIAYMMLNTGMIERPPEEVLDLYFRQCAMSVTASDLAVMAATLANDGTNPLTNRKIYNKQYVRDVLTVMNTCGMYDYAGEWAYEVGMPAKSGVSGCIVAAVPGQVGICVYSPPIDKQGNSVRGIEVCRDISREFQLHSFYNHTNVRSVLRRDYRCDLVRSNRLRAFEENTLLAEEGHQISVIEAQGTLFFGSAEQLLRRLSVLSRDSRFVILDFKRVHHADRAASQLIVRAILAMAASNTELVFSSIDHEGSLHHLIHALEKLEAGNVRQFHNTDAALEWCEDQVLARQGSDDAPKFSLHEINLFNGLTDEERHLVERIVRPLVFEKGDVIMREGGAAKLFFVLARGTVSIETHTDDGLANHRRIHSIGPGLTFGEMALLGREKRSTRVIANEKVICYGLCVVQLQELSETHPNIMISILGNLTHEFSERLRHANKEISILE